MLNPRTSSLLLFSAAAILGAIACGGGGGTEATGGTGAGAAGGAGGVGGAMGGTAGTGTMAAGGRATGGTSGGAPVGGSSGASTAGGSAGTGGGAPVGGSAGGPPVTGGSAGLGAGGAISAGGSAGSPVGGASAGGAGGTPPVGSCTITPTAVQSEEIQTVFNVTFTTDAVAPTAARIEFGKDTTYGYSAPVDLAAPMYKTPLLGMKQDMEHHYRVVVTAGGAECASADQTVTTGFLINGLPKPMIMTPKPEALAGGFLIGAFYASKQAAFILDKDADYVWAFDPKTITPSFGDLTRARMSSDGKYMWIAHGNVPSGTARMMRVSMDGSEAMDMSASFPRLNHDFTVLADETIYFIAYGSGGGSCDEIGKYSNGQTSVLLNLNKAFPSGACHANAIEYSPDDTLVVSELDHNAYIKIDLMGNVKWILGGGSENDFTGDGATWTAEHNLHMIAKDRMLMFNNGPGMGTSSKAIELQLDETAKTATKVWEYTPSSVIANVVMGDVQRLPNENTLVTFSTQGVIHEVAKDKSLVQSLSWGTQGSMGYTIKRPTLYGPSPK